MDVHEHICIAPGGGLSGRWDGAERIYTGEGTLVYASSTVHVEASYGTVRLTLQDCDIMHVQDHDLPHGSTLAANLRFIEACARELIDPS